MRIPYRKTYEVVGYTFDGAAFCPVHIDPHTTNDHTGDQPTPVFLDQSEDMQCDVCLIPLEEA